MPCLLSPRSRPLLISLDASQLFAIAIFTITFHVYSYASVMGLPIVGTQYNLVALAFYVGFLVWGKFFHPSSIHLGIVPVA